MDNFSSRVDAIASTYSTDTIFILGKGPSADDIPVEIFSGSLVIGLNDAERIYPADISIFHANWVSRSIAETGPRSRIYLTSTDFETVNAEVVHRPHIPLSQETADLMVQRLLSQEFVVEDVLFMSALRIAREVADLTGRTQKVYMVGFDFRPDLGYAHVEGKQFGQGDDDERGMRIGMQENYLLNALYMLQGTGVDVCHVGTRPYSRLTSDELVETFRHELRMPKRSHDWKVSVTAELTTNHFGDIGRMERMVRAAHAAGVNFIKVQKRDVDTFYSAEQLAAPYRSPFGTTFGEYRHQLELTGDDFTFLDTLCKQLGIRWFASVLDEPSYNFIRDFDPPLIKLPSTISEHTEYLSRVAANGDQGIVLSTGMTDKAFENWVLSTFRNTPELYMMQANSAYPTPAHDCNVGVVRHYHHLSKSDPRILPAYSSHDEDWFGSALAVAAGALMVEKHVKLGNTDWAHFDAVAMDLTTSQFRDYVSKIREAEILVGSEEKTIASSEHHKYRRR